MNTYQGFQSGRFPIQHFSGDSDPAKSLSHSFLAGSSDIFFGAPVSYENQNGKDVIQLLRTTDNTTPDLFGFATSSRNRMISHESPYFFTQGEFVQIVYFGIINLICHEAISFNQANIYLLTEDIPNQAGTIGQLTSSEPTSAHIDLTCYVRPLSNISGGEAGPFFINLNQCDVSVGPQGPPGNPGRTGFPGADGKDFEGNLPHHLTLLEPNDSDSRIISTKPLTIIAPRIIFSDADGSNTTTIVPGSGIT